MIYLETFIKRGFLHLKKIKSTKYPHYTELVEYAKILFAGDQTLEQLGIMVKR